MTRRKKSRKSGPLAPAKKPKDPNSVAGSVKGKKKGKGQKPGQRHSVSKANERVAGATSNQGDPRKGSRRKIPLVTATKVADAEALSPTAELRLLEQDERLQELVEKFEQGVELTEDEQQYLDNKSERYEQLAAQLGIDLDDEDEWDDEEY